MNEISSNLEKKLQVPERTQNMKLDSESDYIIEDLFQDDYEEGKRIEVNSSEPSEIDSKLEMKELFADDYFGGSESSGESNASSQEHEKEQYGSDFKFEDNVFTPETDDDGHIYKIDDYKLMPNCEYTIDGISYKTDNLGRIVSCDGKARLTPEGERDNKAQIMAGGEDRKPGDQGGHILARIFGGAKGIENMIAMRGTAINQSVYKRVENEIAKALEEGKDVHVHMDVEYTGDLQRPSKITERYTVDGKETVAEFDNNEGSVNLLSSVEDKLEKEDYNDLRQEIQDANDDGGNISVVSVKTEYDEDGNAVKVAVTIRDENSDHPLNEDRIYTPKEAGE